MVVLTNVVIGYTFFTPPKLLLILAIKLMTEINVTYLWGLV